MKFTGGYWHMRPDVTPYFPVQVHEVAIEPDVLTVYGSTKRLTNRGDTLNVLVLTMRLSSPMPDVIRVQLNHHKGQALKKPAFELHYLVKRPDGDVWQWDRWQAGMGLVDFTNPDACRWFGDKVRALLDMGVDCFKTDFGERIPTDVVYFDGSDPVKMHNYPIVFRINRPLYW